jgi:hypothetical protein
MNKILDQKECPEWVKYPDSYLSLISEGKDEFFPWFFFNKTETSKYLGGLRGRYPLRKLFAFAKRDDSDDIACWEADKPGKVVIVHDYASPGWEERQIFDNFDEWYSYALSEKWDEK